METKEYKAGQAVMYPTHFPPQEQKMLICQEYSESNETVWLTGFMFENSGFNAPLNEIRHVTIDEILTELKKNGWVDFGGYKFGIEETQYIYIFLTINGGKKCWGFEFCTEPTLKNLAKYGKECISAHKAITALSLAP